MHSRHRQREAMPECHDRGGTLRDSRHGGTEGQAMSLDTFALLLADGEIPPNNAPERNLLVKEEP